MTNVWHNKEGPPEGAEVPEVAEFYFGPDLAQLNGRAQRRIDQIMVELAFELRDWSEVDERVKRLRRRLQAIMATRGGLEPDMLRSFAERFVALVPEVQRYQARMFRHFETARCTASPLGLLTYEYEQYLESELFGAIRKDVRADMAGLNTDTPSVEN